MKAHRVLFVGVGKLGGYTLDLFLRHPGNHHFLVGGRNVETFQPWVNLSLLAACQLGYAPRVECVSLDLKNVEQTASIIARFQPDVIFCAATTHPGGGLQNLVPSVAQRLASAPLAPRLPGALSLLYKLMQAVHLVGMEHSPKVLNAIFPDMIHPILNKVNLAPTTGIGDLSNNIPALRLLVTRQLEVPLEQVDIRLVMARWVSYWMSRRAVASAPFHISVQIDGQDYTRRLNYESLFEMLRTNFKRIGGDIGLLMTASSAFAVFDAVMRDQAILTHVPGPNGLPGGYPARISAKEVKIALPSDLSFEKAQQFNEAGLSLDGIERIDSHGTVFFTDEAVSVYQEVLGYRCPCLPLSEVDEWAEELEARYLTFKKG